MESLNLTQLVHSQNGTSGNWWSATTYNDQNGDNNNIYYGADNYSYRPRLYFTIPSDAAIVESTKLVVKLAGYGQNSGNIWTKYARAYLSTTNTPSSDYGNLRDLESPITSYFYSDSEGTNRVTGKYSTAVGNDIYLIFPSTGFKAGGTYYIYIMTYTSDSKEIDSPTFTGGTDPSTVWMVWQNNPPGNLTRLTATLYHKSTYTISYDANGGTGAPSAQTKNEGVNLTLSSTTPSYTGRTFAGWSTTKARADAGTIDYDAGATYSTDAAATLYASWTLNTYSIQYNANGGTGAPSAQTKTYGVTLTLSSTEPTRSSAAQTAYTVTLDANGGSLSSESLIAERTKVFTFDKWNTKSDGSGKNYSPGGSYTTNSAATLYAQWNSVINTAAVTLPTPTKSGYTFLGWGTSASASSGITGSYTPTASTTLYALWKADGTVKIYNSTTKKFDIYQAIIYNSSTKEWDLCIPKIYNGSDWNDVYV